MMVDLFGSSQRTETYLRDEELRFESRVTTVSTKQFKSAYKEVQVARLQCIFISVLHLSTLSGWFRVRFGEGHISNTIEH